MLYYRASRAHVHRLNVVHVKNFTHIDRRTDHSRRHWQDYRNHRHAATVVPASALSQRRTLHRDAVRNSPHWMRDVQLADAAPSRARQGSDPERRAVSLRLKGERERRRSGADNVRRTANRSVTTLRESSDRTSRASESVPRASETQTRAHAQARPAPRRVNHGNACGSRCTRRRKRAPNARLRRTHRRASEDVRMVGESKATSKQGRLQPDRRIGTEARGREGRPRVLGWSGDHVSAAAWPDRRRSPA